MPQFDILFFSIILVLILSISSVFIFIFFINFFISFFKVKRFDINFNSQKILILTIKNDIIIVENMRKLWIREKLIEFYAS